MLKDLQQAIARALISDTPMETLRREGAGLGPEDRAYVDRLDADRFVLTSLIVRKLRFERICRGDQKMEDWFSRDPEAFTRAFRAYNRDILPSEFFPREEALAFRQYCRGKGILPS